MDRTRTKISFQWNREDRSIRGPTIDYEDENGALRTGYFYRLDSLTGMFLLNKDGSEVTHVFLFKSLRKREFYCTEERFDELTAQKKKLLEKRDEEQG